VLIVTSCFTPSPLLDLDILFRCAAALLQRCSLNLILRSGLVSGFRKPEVVVHDRTTEYWGTPKEVALQAEVSNGSRLALHRVVSTIATWLRPVVTPGDGNCTFHALRASFRRLGLAWPLGDSVQQDRLLMKARLPDLEMTLIQAFGNETEVEKAIRDLDADLQGPSTPLV
jgi:hypothetical protein